MLSGPMMQPLFWVRVCSSQISSLSMNNLGGQYLGQDLLFTVKFLFTNVSNMQIKQSLPKRDWSNLKQKDPNLIFCTFTRWICLQRFSMWPPQIKTKQQQQSRNRVTVCNSRFSTLIFLQPNCWTTVGLTSSQMRTTDSQLSSVPPECFIYKELVRTLKTHTRKRKL